MDTPESIYICFILLFILAAATASALEMSITSGEQAILPDCPESAATTDLPAVPATERLDDLLTALRLCRLMLLVLSGLTILPLSSSLNLPADNPAVYYAVCCALVIIISLLHLLLGDFLPRLLTLKYAAVIADRLLPAGRLLLLALTPLLPLLRASGEYLSLFLGISRHSSESITEKKVLTMIEQGTASGIFEKSEQTMVDRVFRLSDLKVGALMTPRTQMLWLDAADSPEDSLSVIRSNPTELVYPVCRSGMDDFIGIVYITELFDRLQSNSPLELASCVRQPLFLPKSLPVLDALDVFKHKHANEAIVIDELSGVVGFITIKDILDEIIDDFTPHAQDDASQLIRRSADVYAADGLLPIDDFKEQFAFDALPEEERDQYNTLAGFIISYLGCIPKQGDCFTYGGLEFEIAVMDKVRIAEIIIKKLPAATGQTAHIA